MSARQLRTAFESDPDVAKLIIMTRAQARAGGTTVDLVGIQSVKGDLLPRRVSGRLPATPGEIALGRVTARKLHRHAGDDLDLASATGTTSFRVVGMAVVPGISGGDGVGVGAVVTAAGLRRVEPEPSAALAGIGLRRGAPRDAALRIVKKAGGESIDDAGESIPPSILNVGRVRRIPAALAGLLAALALLTMIHSLIVSINGRRRDFAVVRALGADRRWVARAVHWQATVLTALPLVVGVPLGLVTGSFVFRAFVDRIGALPDPVLPLLVLAVVVAVLIAVANLVAVLPARRARRLPTAELLVSE
jgi:putative ABC transport system permease protein